MSARSCAARCATRRWAAGGVTDRHDETASHAAEVVAFWREAGPERWFKKDPAFDEEIRRRFLATA